MIFRYLDTYVFFMKQSKTSFIVKLAAFKNIWIFNSIEGCQSNMLDQNFKISNVSKIIIADLHINSISGLLGLLSSLNSIGRVKSLHIYGPINLKYYLDFGKKYSHTNFNYVVYLHVLKTGLIINHDCCRIYSFFYQSRYEFVIVKSEKYGTFYLNKAKKNYLIPGPLYGKLKRGCSFLLPDGFILNGSQLTSKTLLGQQISFFVSSYYKRKLFENSDLARIVLLA